MSRVLPKTLFCYKLDPDTFELNQYKIDIFEVKNNYSETMYIGKNEKVYKRSTKIFISSNKLDRFVNNKVYSFSNDIDGALNIILSTLEEQLAESKARTDKLSKLLEGVKNHV